MKLHSLSWTLVLGILITVSLCGCQSPRRPAAFENPQPRPATLAMTTLTNQVDPAWLQPPTNRFTLGPGDRLDIEITGETNSLTSTMVGPDGKIYFYLLPGIEVWGMTLGQARATLENQLKSYLRQPPQLEIMLRSVESKRVWLLGRFQQPGVYNLAGPTTLLEAVSAAGGAQTYSGVQDITSAGPLGADLADLHHSFVVRNGRMLPVDMYGLFNRGDTSQNIYLEPDDFIYFPPAFTHQVYVLGAVTQSRPVPYVENLTLLQAISGAYGTIRDAYLLHVIVIRGSLSQPQVADVNYYDIVHGKTPDVELQPDDIVYVPFSPYRYLRKYVEIALNTFASSVAIDEGSKLVAPKNAFGAGVFIPAGSGVTITPPPAPPIH